MLDDARPIVLRAEDTAEPLNPAIALIELMDLLRLVCDDTLQVRDLLSRRGSDTATLQRRAHPRSVDAAQGAADALESAERLAQALRAARLFSAPYDAFGVR